MKRPSIAFLFSCSCLLGQQGPASVKTSDRPGGASSSISGAGVEDHAGKANPQDGSGIISLLNPDQIPQPSEKSAHQIGRAATSGSPGSFHCNAAATEAPLQSILRCLDRGVGASERVAALSSANSSSAPFKISLVALAAANVADITSSWNRRELNPLLGPTFGAKSVAIKSSITAALVLAEIGIVRRHPGMKHTLTIGNWIAAGVVSSVAIRNLGVSR